MKKLTAALLTLVMLLSLASCGQEPSASSSSDSPSASSSAAPGTNNTDSDKETIQLGFSVALWDETSELVWGMIQDSAKTLGEKYNVNIEVSSADAGGSVDKQLSDVETFVSMGCDAISIRVVDPDGSAPAFDYATSQGVPCLATWWSVNTDNKIGELVIVDNYYIGQLQAEWVINYAESNDVTLKVGYLDGRIANPSSQVRCTAFQDTIAEKYGDLTSGKVQVIAVDYGEMDTAASMTIVENWSQVYGNEINCIVCANDDSAAGAINVLKANGTLENTLVLGANGTTWLGLVRDGEMAATVRLETERGVEKEVETLVLAALGMEIPELNEPMYDAMILVDSANVDEFPEE